jgi:hypothetical protein
VGTPTPHLEDLLGLPRRGPGGLRGLLIGAAIGALAAWLTVPLRGQELRRLLRASWLTVRSRLIRRDDRLI